MYNLIYESLSRDSIDILLDKIIDVGYDNLSDKEKDMLNNPHKYNDDYLYYFNKPLVHYFKKGDVLKIYDDENITIRLTKRMDDKNQLKFFVNFKKINKNNILCDSVIKFNLSTIKPPLHGEIKIKLDMTDIYDNNFMDQEYVTFLREHESYIINEYTKNISLIDNITTDIISSMISVYFIKTG
jgi:hypothetical protein